MQRIVLTYYATERALLSLVLQKLNVFARFVVVTPLGGRLMVIHAMPWSDGQMRSQTKGRFGTRTVSSGCAPGSFLQVSSTFVRDYECPSGSSSRFPLHSRQVTMAVCDLSAYLGCMHLLSQMYVARPGTLCNSLALMVQCCAAGNSLGRYCSR